MRWLLCVALVAPPADSPVEDRQRAWEQLRPVSASLTDWEFSRAPGFAATKVATDVESMTLANGAVIEDPRDFLPVVSKDSVTAQEAKAWNASRQRWNVFSGVVLSGLGVGLGVLLAAPAISSALGTGADGAYALAMGGLINAIVVPLIGLIVPAIFVGSPDAHRVAAFAHYEADLISFLGP